MVPISRPPTGCPPNRSLAARPALPGSREPPLPVGSSESPRFDPDVGVRLPSEYFKCLPSGVPVGGQIWRSFAGGRLGPLGRGPPKYCGTSQGGQTTGSTRNGRRDQTNPAGPIPSGPVFRAPGACASRWPGRALSAGGRRPCSAAWVYRAAVVGAGSWPGCNQRPRPFRLKQKRLVGAMPGRRRQYTTKGLALVHRRGGILWPAP